jgi:hypothetical protein
MGPSDDGAIGAHGHFEQGQNLLLQIGEFRIKGVDGFSVMLKDMALCEAEQTQDLLGGWPSG